MGLTQYQPVDDESERLLTAAARYGGVLLPPLTAGDLYALCGESQVTLEGDEATWWAGMTAPGRAAMKAVAVDMLLSRDLLVPGSDGSFEVAPGVAVTLAARQDPSVMVACTRPDGVTAWAPRLYGIGEPGQRPRAIVLEIVMDKIHGLFGPLHEFGLMPVDAAVRFLTWWVQTPFRARYTRKEPPRQVTVFRAPAADPGAEMECHELVITLERTGVLGVTVDRDDGRPETVTCEPRSLARLFARLLGPVPG
jgi:hypothetical protein